MSDEPIEYTEKENRELNSIKKFAEKNGINIFLIDEAFRKCWKDNGKLFEENEKLRKELNKYKIVILQFVGLLAENGIMESSVKEEVDELLEELSGDGV